jgi:NhaP-type Na+/H+ or K+/H+ antiporter
MAVLFVVAVVSLIVDQNTGDTSGPPYHDSLLNHAAFFAFFGSAAAVGILAVIALIGWVYRRLRRRTESAKQCAF